MTRPWTKGAVALLSAAAWVFLGGCGSSQPGDEDTPIVMDPGTVETTGTAPAETAPAETVPVETAPADTAPANTGQPPADSSAVVLQDRERHRVTDAASALVHCEGRADIEIVASDIEVTITGTCDEVGVDGSGTTVSMETAEDLEVDGNGNTVTATVVDDVSIDGNDNTVTLDEIRKELDLDGDNNAVTFTAGTPEIDDDGTGNQINQG